MTAKPYKRPSPQVLQAREMERYALELEKEGRSPSELQDAWLVVGDAWELAGKPARAEAARAGKLKPSTRVMFRVWGRHAPEYARGGVFALFIDEPWVAGRRDSVTYFDQQGHGDGDYGHCISSSRPAREGEYASMKRYLEENYGYNLKIARRR